MNVATGNFRCLYLIADEHDAGGRYEKAALAPHYAAQAGRLTIRRCVC